MCNLFKRKPEFVYVLYEDENAKMVSFEWEVTVSIPVPASVAREFWRELRRVKYLCVAEIPYTEGINGEYLYEYLARETSLPQRKLKARYRKGFCNPFARIDIERHFLPQPEHMYLLCFTEEPFPCANDEFIYAERYFTIIREATYKAVIEGNTSQVFDKCNPYRQIWQTAAALQKEVVE